VSRFAEARFLLSVASLAQFPPDRGVEVAFAGRSNAGKSSAINAILARRSLARTGKTPGQTRLINYFDLGAERRIVDLPGYGYARVPERERAAWGPLLGRLRERRSLHGLFVVVDARRGVGALDLTLIDWAVRPPASSAPPPASSARPPVPSALLPASVAPPLASSAEPPRAVHVLLTKADKLSRGEAARTLREAQEAVRAHAARAGPCATVQLFSILDGRGIAEAQQVLSDWLAGRTNKKTPETSGEATGAD